MRGPHPALIAVALSATPLAAQYRGEPPSPGYRAGQPDVLPRAPGPADPGIAGAATFRSRYAAAGRPRMMLLWNRAFSDEVGSAYRDHLHVETDSSADTATTQSAARTWYGAAGRQDTTAHGHASLDATEGLERVSGERDSPLAERADWEMESAFATELAANGVTLIDRAAAMRLTGREAGDGATPNVQAIEARAAAARADFLIEILQTTAWDGPAGALFKISVKTMRDARLVAMLTSTGRPLAHAMPFVAGPNGYIRASAAAPSASDVGRRLAYEVMASIAGAL